MRASRSHGRAGTTVVPPGWGASHATVLARTRTAVVSLSAASTPGEWDPVNEVTTPATGGVYATSVAASVNALPTGGRDGIDVAEETLATSDYVIGVDVDGVTAGDIVTVTAAPGSPDLVGRLLRVDRVDLSGERFETVLYATLLDTTAASA